MCIPGPARLLAYTCFLDLGISLDMHAHLTDMILVIPPPSTIIHYGLQG